jgi:hypothetical protein
MLKHITINWQDKKSIEKAEREKEKLEAEGFALIDAVGGFVTSKLVYKK